MTPTRTLPDEATVRLSLAELCIVSNALNEVCHGLDIDGFSTRMGVGREGCGRAPRTGPCAHRSHGARV